MSKIWCGESSYPDVHAAAQLQMEKKCFCVQPSHGSCSKHGGSDTSNFCSLLLPLVDERHAIVDEIPASPCPCMHQLYSKPALKVGAVVLTCVGDERLEHLAGIAGIVAQPPMLGSRRSLCTAANAHEHT
jgi:hypothetical protein